MRQVIQRIRSLPTTGAVMDIVPIEAGTLLKSPDKIVLIIWY